VTTSCSTAEGKFLSEKNSAELQGKESLFLTDCLTGQGPVRPIGGPVPVAPNKLGAWGCGLVSTTIAG
jgi:hypothetical protein